MRGTIAVTDAITPITTKTNWLEITFANTGSEIAYLQWTTETDALTSAKGFPIAAGAVFILSPPLVKARVPVSAICASGKATSLRVVIDFDPASSVNIAS